MSTDSKINQAKLLSGLKLIELQPKLHILASLESQLNTLNHLTPSTTHIAVMMGSHHPKNYPDRDSSASAKEPHIGHFTDKAKKKKKSKRQWLDCLHSPLS